MENGAYNDGIDHTADSSRLRKCVDEDLVDIEVEFDQDENLAPHDVFKFPFVHKLTLFDQFEGYRHSRSQSTCGGPSVDFK